MSPSIRFTRTAGVTLVGIGMAAVTAAFCVGLTGWPPAHANAESAPNSLGITEASAVSLPEASSASDKFAGSAVASTTLRAAAARPTLLSTTAKSLARTRRGAMRKPSAMLLVGRPTGRGWQRCRVSWYGPGFYGHTMAGGGRLRRSSMIVAHRSLPFGTQVQIFYRGRMVTAVVKDRGPFVRGRTFDLGPGTAKALRFSGVGAIRYKIARR